MENNQYQKNIHSTSTTKPLNAKRSSPSIEKNGELAVFYNMAYNRMSKLIADFERKEKGSVTFNELRDLFFPAGVDSITEDSLCNAIGGLSNRTYTELKVMLWNEPLSKKLRFVTQEEREIINHLLLTLLRLRDYHSHYYHHQLALIPYPKARGFLEQKFDIACKSYRPTLSIADPIIEHFSLWNHKEPQYLGMHGINFFLSFFLTRGQMELFMKARQYLNRSGFENSYDKINRTKMEDVRDFEKSRYITSFYAGRDAAQRSIHFLAKDQLTEWSLNDYYGMQLRNYLESVPSFITDQLTESQLTEVVKRGKQSPVKLLATLLALKPLVGISWSVRSNESKELKTNESEETETQKLPIARYSTQKVYLDKLEITPLKKEDSEAHESVDSSVQLPEIHAAHDHVQIRIILSDQRFFYFTMGLDNLLHWALLITRNRSEDVLKSLKQFATDFSNWIDALEKDEQFDLEQSYLQHFIPKKLDDKRVSSLALPQILLQLAKGTSKQDDLAILKLKVKEKINHSLETTNANHFAAKVAYYNRIQTDYLTNIEQKETNTKINTIRNRIKNPNQQVSSHDLYKLDEFERSNQRLEQHRFEKMQVLLTAVEWLVGRKGRFRSAEQKNQWMKYCYLLDLQDHKSDNRSLIIDWISTVEPIDKKTDEKNVQVDYASAVLKILTLEATSFDNCFLRLGELALEKYRETLKRVDSFDSYDNLIGLARRLKISNPSNTELSNKTDTTKTRRSEILSTFSKKINGTHHYYLHMPESFFIRTEKITNAEVKGLLKETQDTIVEHWQQLAGNQQSNDLFPKPYSELIEQQKNAKGNTVLLGVLRKHIAARKLLDKHLKIDAVLTRLKAHLKFTDINMQSISQGVRKVHKNTIVQTIAGCKVQLTLKQLTQHDFYWDNGRIEKVILRLKQENPSKETYNFEELKTALHVHWKESIRFVSGLLTAEAALNLRLPKSEQPHPLQKAYPYVPFEELLPKLTILNTGDLSKLRNSALHADVLDTTKKYADYLAKLESSIQKTAPKQR